MHASVKLDPTAVYDDGAILVSLGIAPGTLHRARKHGALRYTQQGRRTLYLGQWLIDWLTTESRQAHSSAQKKEAAS